MRSARRLWERVRNVPGLGRDLVAFAVLLAITLGSTGYIVSQYDTRPPWQDEVLVAAEFEKAPSVREQTRQEVRIAGVPVGRIVSAEPLPNGNARVVMSLRPGHTVYANARAVLRTKTPINVMYIALDPGGPPAPPLPRDGSIPATQTERLIQPWEVLNKLDERTQSALTSLLNESDAALASAPEHLPRGLRATDATLAVYRPVVEQLQTRREKIATLVTALARISTAVGEDHGRLARLTSALQQSLRVLANRDKKLNATLAQLPDFAGALKRATSSTTGLTKQLNPTLDALHGAADELPTALSRLTGTVKQAGRVIDAARPVVATGERVVADLRPLAGDLDASLDDLAAVTEHLPSATKRILARNACSTMPWMEDLAAFVYQTSSAASLFDVNGGLARSNSTQDPGNPSGNGARDMRRPECDGRNIGR